MLGAHERPSWPQDGRDWPNREASRFVPAGGLDWHVQQLGAGPALLLLHGTGAATHSFRDLAPALASDFSLLAPDLPGHGFTGMPGRDGLSLPGMARALGTLLAKTRFEPEIGVGHSAGAAILIAMALTGAIRPRLIVALNGALRPLDGAALFSPLARLLFVNPIAPNIFAWRAANPHATSRLLDSTGSKIDARGVELYRRMFRRPGHIAGTLGMMAGWDLVWLQRNLPALGVPLVLVTAAGDRTIAPRDAHVSASRAPQARVVALGHGGHLVHEEAPGEIAELIKRLWREETGGPR